MLRLNNPCSKSSHTSPRDNWMRCKYPFFMAKKAELNLKNIWPQERDYVVRPERLKYVRRSIEPKTCVFCDATEAKDLAANLVVFKGQRSMVVLNKYPYNSGHVLVMPLRHEGHLEGLTLEEHNEMFSLVKESVRILKKIYSCQGINVGLNLGSAAGAGIPDHLHVHVLPRWHGDTNFFPLIAETKLIVETLDSTYEKLSLEFKKIQKKYKKMVNVKSAKKIKK